LPGNGPGKGVTGVIFRLQPCVNGVWKRQLRPCRDAIPYPEPDTRQPLCQAIPDFRHPLMNRYRA